jgi:hypothetical protein
VVLVRGDPVEVQRSAPDERTHFELRRKKSAVVPVIAGIWLSDATSRTQ